MNGTLLGGVPIPATLLFLLVLVAGPAAPSPEDGDSATGSPAAGSSAAGSPAAEPAALWRIGVLFWHESPNDLAALGGIREGFAATGRPHELIVSQAHSDRVEALRIVRRFREEKVDLLLAMGTEAARIAASEVTGIPIVFTAVTNPVESGVVASWNGSGRNIAGNSNWIGPDTLLDVFLLAVPRLERIGILRSRDCTVSAAELRGMRDHLARSGTPEVTIVEEIADGVAGIEDAANRLVAEDVQAIWIPIDYTVYNSLDRVHNAVRPHGVPLVSSSLKAAKAGAVAGVLVDYAMLGKRAVVLAVEILGKGSDPGALPVGTMEGYQVVVNITAAERCGYEVPLSLLALADLILEEGRGDE